MKADAHDDRLALSVGDGGRATMRFIREEILSRFGSKSLLPLEDGATIDCHGGSLVITTDSFIVDPPEFPGGDIGRLAVSGAVNDLVASGAAPRYLTMALVVAAGFPLPALRRILDSMATVAADTGIELVAGDTKVLSESKSGLRICIQTTGLGVLLDPARDFGLRRAQPGDRLIVTGFVGDHALAVLSAREGLGFEQRVSSDCAPLHSLVAPVLEVEPGVHALRDPTRGGLKGVLIDIAEATGLDVVVSERAIPIRAEVRCGCEMLGLDPLDLVNEGKMVLAVDAEAAERVLRRLQGHPLGRESAIIGYIDLVRSNGAGQLLIRTDGQTRVALRPEGTAIPRLC